MTLYLPDKWVWDFWFAQDGANTHVFYLQALRALDDPDLRHWNVTIGHAVSEDLVNWEILPDAFAPSASPAWDDYTTWTGSIIQHEGLWYLFYTGSSRADDGKIQRIGLATSSDLLTWQKHPQNPLIEADATWYERYDKENPLWWDEAWRDPFVFQHPETGDFHAFITARANQGKPDERGVIGYARSNDLITWEVCPPVSEPGDFGYLEVPQWLEFDGNSYLIFSTTVKTHAKGWEERMGLPPVNGTMYLTAPKPLGPYTLPVPRPFLGYPDQNLYAGKLIQNQNGEWVFFAWQGSDANFIGTLSDPIPVTVHEDGTVTLS